MNLLGTWYNELGSTLVIDSVANGQLTGSYITPVSAAAGVQGRFALTGQTDVDSGGEAIAFVVCWRNQEFQCKSITAWSGQAQTLNGDDVITSFWLLTVESSPTDDWYATHVGQDVFWRDQRKATQAGPRLRTVRAAHPSR